MRATLIVYLLRGKENREQSENLFVSNEYYVLLEVAGEEKNLPIPEIFYQNDLLRAYPLVIHL
jgi:hypothetical protein|tara:strand:- start:1968 stop:2156 length:189 start_codon:yes stop_codon:yes gene_type:complete